MTLISTLSLWATPLDGDHFLYPRDVEVLWLTNIESPLGIGALKRNSEACRKGGSSLSGFLFFHCDVFKNVEEVKLEPSYDSDHFGDITFFGETHINSKGQYYLASVIENSPEGYFHTLALEMLNEWAQEDIDHLIKSRASLEEWSELFGKHWRYDPAGYMAVIKAALDKKMKIIALDDRRDERGLTRGESFSDDLIYRDQVMAKNLTEQIFNFPDKKVLALTGKLHSFPKISERPLTIAEIVKENLPGLKTFHYLLFQNKGSKFFRSHFPEKAPPYKLKASEALEDYGQFFVFF